MHFEGTNELAIEGNIFNGLHYDGGSLCLSNVDGLEMHLNNSDDAGTTKITGDIATLNSFVALSDLIVNLGVEDWEDMDIVVEWRSMPPSRTNLMTAPASAAARSSESLDNHHPYRGNSVHSVFTGAAADHYLVFKSETDQRPFDPLAREHDRPEGTHLTFTDGARWDMTKMQNRIRGMDLTNEAVVEFKAGDADGEFGRLVLDGDLTGEGGAFKVKDTETELQGFHYNVERRADGEDGFNVKWILKAVTPINSSLTETGIAMNRLDYDALRGRDATLCERLGHLRTFHAATGAWVRLDGQTRKDAPLKDRDNGVTIGVDRRGDTGGIYGLYLRYGDGNSHYDTGTSKNRTGTIGAYYTKFFDEDLYLDFAADFSRTRKKLSIDGEPGWSSHKRINRNSGTASIEAGRTFRRDRWFVEPRVRFTLGALGKTYFDTDTGAHVSVGSRVAALTRLGTQAGMKINEGCMINLTADVLHDFGRVKGETTVTKDGNTVKADYKNKRTRAELGAAFSWELKNDFRLHGDVKRALGSGYGNDWRWHVSLEHLF